MTMKYKKVRDTLEGLYAGAQGFGDSGIRDNALREKVWRQLVAEMGEHEVMPRVTLSRVLRDLFLTDEAIGQGYGIEDAHDFIVWCENELEWLHDLDAARARMG